MGLAQRRIIAEYKEKEYPKWKAQFDAAAGFDLPLEVRWDTLADDSYEDKDMYFQCFDKVFFRPFLTVIKNICMDDMGKAAFRERMKKIVWNGTEGWGTHSTSFDDGNLLIKHKPFTNVDHEEDRIKGWQTIIEQKL